MLKAQDLTMFPACAKLWLNASVFLATILLDEPMGISGGSEGASPDAPFLFFAPFGGRVS